MNNTYLADYTMDVWACVGCGHENAPKVLLCNKCNMPKIVKVFQWTFLYSVWTQIYGWSVQDVLPNEWFKVEDAQL